MIGSVRFMYTTNVLNDREAKIFSGKNNLYDFDPLRVFQRLHTKIYETVMIIERVCFGVRCEH